MPLQPTSMAGRAFLEARTLHIEDVESVIDTEYPAARAAFDRVRHRSVLVVPMVLEGKGNRHDQPLPAGSQAIHS
jgi:hypothetical protein